MFGVLESEDIDNAKAVIVSLGGHLLDHMIAGDVEQVGEELGSFLIRCREWVPALCLCWVDTYKQWSCAGLPLSTAAAVEFYVIDDDTGVKTLSGRPDRMTDGQWWAWRLIQARCRDDKDATTRLLRETDALSLREYADHVCALLELAATTMRTMKPGYAVVPMGGAGWGLN